MVRRGGLRMTAQGRGEMFRCPENGGSSRRKATQVFANGRHSIRYHDSYDSLRAFVNRSFSKPDINGLRKMANMSDIDEHNSFFALRFIQKPTRIPKSKYEILKLCKFLLSSLLTG
jgi:hypothetical protein